jgi:8-oxo-dGTP pyrophosphatase MutT (NUDIX family)
MHRKPLLDLLAGYSPTDQAEHEMWEQTLTFVNAHTHCFERSLLIGHVTGSAWVVSEDYQEVLLMHHRKLDKWFQPGGHCDGQPDVASVAMREALEETGVSLLSLPDPLPIFDIDIHPIPARAHEPEHLHYDIRFLLLADRTAPLQPNSESKEVRWVALDSVAGYNASESILRMARKTTALRAMI